MQPVSKLLRLLFLGCQTKCIALPPYIMTALGMLLLLLLSRFSRVRLCVTPQTAVHQAPQSLGFSMQEHWSALPFPSPVRESEVTQSCPTLSHPMDCSLPGSSVHGIFQARVLEWGAIAFSPLGITQPKQQTSEILYFHTQVNLYEIKPIVPFPLALCSGLKYFPVPYSMTSINLGHDCPSLRRSLWMSIMPSLRQLHSSYAFLKSPFQREIEFSRKYALKIFASNFHQPNIKLGNQKHKTLKCAYMFQFNNQGNFVVD